MQALIALPALLVAVAAFTWGPRRAVVFVLLPLLLLLPNHYEWEVKGIPRLDFHNYAFGIALLALLLKERRLLRWAFLDVLVLCYWIWPVVSEYTNVGFEEARNIAALSALAILAPYFLGRALAGSPAFSTSFVAMLTICCAFIGLLTVYEARMGHNLFEWPEQYLDSENWKRTLYRGGVRRASGPLGHPICLGFLFAMVLPLAYWVWSHGSRASRTPFLVCFALCLVGLITPISRGPMLGALVSLLFMRLGWMRYRALIGGGLAFAGVLGTLWVLPDVVDYLSVARVDATTAEQETAAYRTEMFRNYLEVVMEEPVFGYGHLEWPVIERQESIDNQYLLLGLEHGIPAVVALLLTLLVPTVRLFAYLLHSSHDNPDARLGWALVGVVAGAVVIQATVWGGTQTVQVLFLLVGMAVTWPIRLKPETVGIRGFVWDFVLHLSGRPPTRLAAPVLQEGRP